ncbi:MAG TPA: COX15/CtaA family protein, partial [Candidatus Thalassarchaeaceae archaeon]|nr:COX15/CtaA family protein [Candidatus Thalassarchaeaceae archaeon]
MVRSTSELIAMRGFLDVKGLTAFLIGVTLLVIAVGGLIRINDAGEACPDWPRCFDSWGFDVSEEEQGDWYESNPEEYDSRGSGHRYSTFQIFTEWFHRFLAGVVLGPLVIANWWLVKSDKTLGPEAISASNISVALIIWQGAIGWLTVKMDNEHWSVALHLGSALAFLLSMFWLWLVICDHRGERHRWVDFDPDFSFKWRNRIFWLVIGGFVTLFSGVFVSTTPGANFGCGVNGIPKTWPLCQGEIASNIEDAVAQSQV